MAGVNGPLTTSYLEEREVNSEYGEIWHEGYYQGDLIAFSGTISIERRDVPVAGQDATVYRRGRVTRTGTLSVAKCDSRWEALIIYYAGLSVDQRRTLRDSGIDPFPSTTLLIRLNDPDSWGEEDIQIVGVKFWEIGIGFAGSSIIQRDLPVTWQSETMLDAIPRPGQLQTSSEGIPASGTGTTYPSYGGNPVI